MTKLGNFLWFSSLTHKCSTKMTPSCRHHREHKPCFNQPLSDIYCGCVVTKISTLRTSFRPFVWPEVSVVVCTDFLSSRMQRNTDAFIWQTAEATPVSYHRGVNNPLLRSLKKSNVGNVIKGSLAFLENID